MSQKIPMSQTIHENPLEVWWKEEVGRLRARIRDAEQNAVAEAIGHALGYTTEQRLVVTSALAARLAEVAALRHTVTQQQDELRRLEASDAANKCGDLRERAEVAEQEVAHLRDRLDRTTAVLVAERREVFRSADERDAMATRLAHQTTLIREQQMVIDHLRRPLKARVVARVARWVRG